MSAPNNERLLELLATAKDPDLALGPLDLRDFESALEELQALRRAQAQPTELAKIGQEGAVSIGLREAAAAAPVGPLRIRLEQAASVVDTLAMAVGMALDREGLRNGPLGESLRAALSIAGY